MLDRCRDSGLRGPCGNPAAIDHYAAGVTYAAHGVVRLSTGPANCRMAKTNPVPHKDASDLTGAEGHGDLVARLPRTHERPVGIDLLRVLREAPTVAAVVQAGLRAAQGRWEDEVTTAGVKDDLKGLGLWAADAELPVVGTLVVNGPFAAVQRDQLSPQSDGEGGGPPVGTPRAAGCQGGPAADGQHCHGPWSRHRRLGRGTTREWHSVSEARMQARKCGGDPQGH
mmetsp:Transcript_121116/g.353930  ORF Transcript_121116/g.353930 Transcript_121116/m.353930 type:complete len:226 (+) Transcript_121116:971-1648(+)